MGMGTARRCAMFRGVAAACAALAFVALATALWARAAGAVVVFPKGSDRPIKGYLVRVGPEVITVGEPQSDGRIVHRDLRRDQIDDIIYTVSRERLEVLDPDSPRAYRDYAEELAIKRDDPEARDAALRLYLIAAWLDPGNLGRSSLLGITQLARDAHEERKFRAMAYLIDPGHDRGVLREPEPVRPTFAGTPDDGGDALLKAVQSLRQGRFPQALALLRRPNVREALGRLATGLDFDELAAAAETRGICGKCRLGMIKCPVCDGKGLVGGSTCGECRGARQILCPDCNGNYREYLPRDLLTKLLSIELTLTGAGPPTALPAAPADKPMSANWSKIAARGELSPAPSLSLETFTEFDPRLCLYRNGEWIAPP
jgi:hypothetical protein